MGMRPIVALYTVFLSHCRHSGGKADKAQQGKVIPGAAGKKTFSSSYAGAGKATVGKTPPGKTAVETLMEKTNVTTGGSQPAASSFTKVFVCPSLSPATFYIPSSDPPLTKYMYMYIYTCRSRSLLFIFFLSFTGQ